MRDLFNTDVIEIAVVQNFGYLAVGGWQEANVIKLALNLDLGFKVCKVGCKVDVLEKLNVHK